MATKKKVTSKSLNTKLKEIGVRLPHGYEVVKRAPAKKRVTKKKSVRKRTAARKRTAKKK